jgi:ParB family transcriptional regulator, chromosome partitioning protein
MARKPGLGRGLGNLIPEAPKDEPVVEATIAVDASPYRRIPIANIVANPNQPRKVFDDASLSGLAASIGSVGLIQPIIVRQTGENSYELIAGERRLRASTLAGLESIPALVHDDVTDAVSLEHAIVENLHRVDLNALEEAAAYQQLIDDFSLTHEQVAERVGKNRATVTNTLRLLQLGDAAQTALVRGTISAGHARTLLAVTDGEAQASLVKKIVAGELSVRATEDAVRALSEPKPPVKGAVKKPTLRPVPDASVSELERLLEDYLDTRVHVEIKGKQGRITIDFADLDDLERIYTEIAKPK